MTSRPPCSRVRTCTGTARPASPVRCSICPIHCPLHHPRRVNTGRRPGGTVELHVLRCTVPEPRQAAAHGTTTARRHRLMSVPTRPVVDDATADALAALALGQTAILEQAEDLREQLRQGSGLDPRSFSLVKIAALVAIDAPPASFMWQVGEALDAGARPREILGVLTAIAPQVGIPRVVAAAPEIMLALDLELPDDEDA